MRAGAQYGIAGLALLGLVASSACSSPEGDCSSGARCAAPHECDAGETRACTAHACPMFVDACNWVYADLPGVQQCQYGQWSSVCECPFDAPPGHPLGCPCTIEAERTCNGAQCQSGVWVASGPCMPEGCIYPCVLDAADAGGGADAASAPDAGG